jgi:hypothetical protein
VIFFAWRLAAPGEWQRVRRSRALTARLAPDVNRPRARVAAAGRGTDQISLTPWLRTRKYTATMESSVPFTTSTTGADHVLAR